MPETRLRKGLAPQLAALLASMLVLPAGACSTPAPEPPLSPEDLRVTVLAEGGEGVIWAGTADGRLLRYRHRRWESQQAPGDRGWGCINDILVHSSGTVWVGAHRGLYRFDGRWRDVTGAVPEPFAGRVLAMADIGDGAVWAAAGDPRTGAGAVARFDGTGWAAWSLHDRLAVVSPTTPTPWRLLSGGPGTLWLGTTAAGAARFDYHHARWELHDVSTGSLWDDHVWGLAAAGGTVWVATNRGLSRFDPDAGWHTFAGAAGPLPDDRLRSLLVTAAGELWVGTFSGEVARLGSNGRWQVYGAPEGAAVTALAEDGAGNVWAATDGGGMLRFDPGAEAGATGFPVGAGAPDRVTALLAAGDGSVWAGAPGGRVVRLHPTAEGTFIVEAFVLAPPAGLPARERVAVHLDEDMVPVAAGSFLRGTDEAREGPARSLYLDAFEIDRHEVTNVQYWRFVRATGHPSPPTWPGGEFAPGEGLHPAAGIAWRSADAYCTWAGKRLPSEAEWEKAARGADGRTWPWGNHWEPDNANTADGDAAAPVAVGSYPAGASPYGLLDMAGNVAEWVADYYDPGYYAAAPARNPPGPPTVTGRVLRGGSWSSPPERVTTTFRGSSHSSTPDYRVGFRCARDTPPTG